MKNPLNILIITALINEEIAKIEEQRQEYKKYKIDGYIPNNIQIINDNLYGYKKIEHAAIAKTCKYCINNNYNIIYENTLFMNLHGIDLIATKNNKYYLFEIKGTTKDIKSPKYYLKKTKNKGRQLSWKWCWNSIMDFAEYPFTATLFLKLFKKILNKEIYRILSVVKCEKLPDKSYIGKEIKIFDINSIILEDNYCFDKQLKMLQKIEKEMKKKN